MPTLIGVWLWLYTDPRDIVLKDRLITAGNALLARLSLLVQNHPKRVTTGLAAMLLTGGGAAFAVASLDSTQQDVQVRTITQPVASLADGSTLADLADLNHFTLFRSDYTRSTDSAESLLQRMGIADPVASSFLRSDDMVRQHMLGRAGRLVSAEASNDHQLQKLTARWILNDESEDFQRLVVERDANGQFSSKVESAPLTINTRLAGGVIRSSLFAATDAAFIPDSVAVQMADVLSGSIDFRRSLRKEDRFSVVYESLEADGEPLRAGRLLSVEFHNNGKTHQAIWYQPEGSSRGNYYDLDGRSLRQAYMASPVEFSRVSSGFAMRFHPIQKTWKAHLGTDFAAPTGTKVRTIGDGVVEFAGVQNGFGNVVFIKHANTAHETVYAHLSRIDVKKGQAVAQGQTIGAVGSTGWATGPHLHFEFRVNGKHQDPQVVMAKAAAEAPVNRQNEAAFKQLSAQMRMQLDSAATIQQASAQ
jgi:murein DD-endopeptidase MepM/ murein hydrolase activator NlpD